MERKIYVQTELIEEMGFEFFKGLEANDLVFTRQGLQDEGYFLEMDDYGNCYCYLDEFDGGYIEL